MKNFELFIRECTHMWHSENTTSLNIEQLKKQRESEFDGLAEYYIIRRVANLKPSYTGIKSKDVYPQSYVFCISLRQGYWHIMLLQVKKSINKCNKELITTKEMSDLHNFAKFIKYRIRFSEYLENYRNNAMIISSGAVKIESVKIGQLIHHKITNTKMFKIYKKSGKELNMIDVKRQVRKMHKLQLEMVKKKV